MIYENEHRRLVTFTRRFCVDYDKESNENIESENEEIIKSESKEHSEHWKNGRETKNS